MPRLIGSVSNQNILLQPNGTGLVQSSAYHGAPGFTPGFTTQAGVNFTAIVLTATSNEVQAITGTAVGASFTLPTSSTVPNGGQFTIINLSTQSVAVNSSGGNLIATLPANANTMFTMVNNSVTTAAAWSYGNGVPLITSYTTSTTALTVTFGGGSPGTMAISNQSSIKINQMVYIAIYLAWTNKTGAGTGALLISGLPYQSVSTYGAGLTINSMSGVTFTGQVLPRINVLATTATIAQIASAGALTTWTDANIGATTQIMMSGVYQTN
jgi:hypothetical protein